MVYVMSDVHGNAKAFHSILKQIQLTEHDTLYILGDIIDRHPYGIDILQEIMKMPAVKMLLGNHEYMMLAACDFNASTDLDRIIKAQRIWHSNCSQVTHAALHQLSEVKRQEIFKFLHSLPLNIDVKVNGIQYKLVHGSPLENFSEYQHYYESETEYAVWHRWKPTEPVPDGYTLIFGHTPTRKFQDNNPLCIWYGKHAIGIDCGSGFPDLPPVSMQKGRLACLRLDDMKEFYSEN